METIGVVASPIIIILFLVGIISLFGTRRRLGTKMSTLVLRKFVVSEDPTEETLLLIVGRKSGLMGWLQTVLGLGAETTLRVTKRDMLFRDTSLSGGSDSLLSLKGGIASVHCGFINRSCISFWPFFLRCPDS